MMQNLKKTVVMT